ncbi:MAG: AMP-binding protein [Myxococcales bacterium]|nr:AMP-binding protein [Myxococcales bacterium]
MNRQKLSYEHGTSEFPLLHLTIGELFDHIAETFPDNECVVSVYQKARFTYREFNDLTDRLAKGLLLLDVKHGDRVSLWAINRWEWVAMQVATAKIGAVLVNINPAYRTHELKYALQQSESSTLVLMDSYKSSKYREMLLEVCPSIALDAPGRTKIDDLPNLRNVILMDGESAGMFPFNDILESGGPVPQEELRRVQAELDPDDPVNIQYTSGTTGFPKGVTLTHFNIMNNGHHVAHIMNFTDRDRLCIPVPFYHCFGMVLSNLVCMSQGATMVIPSPTFEVEAVLKTIQEEKCTGLNSVPTMFISLLASPNFDQYDYRTLRTGIMAGAPCPIDTMRELIDRMNMREIVIGYGQTEASPITTMTRPQDSLEKRVASVGRVVPMQEIKVIDPATGLTVPRGVQGEICFRGYQIMRGYYNNPTATAEAIDAARWLHSGDLGVMDNAGYLKITGRIKEMVIRGGENLYPREIEEFLRGHDKVLDVYVIGVPDAKYGEELMAWVLPRDGETLTEEEMRAYCKGKITHFKVPRYWKFVTSMNEFPMTVTGKIQKFRMREQAIDELNLHDAASIKTA